VRNLLFAAIAAVLAATCAVAGEDYEMPRWYVGAAGTLVLPQGGSSMRRLGGGAVRAGYYVSDAFAVEAEAGSFENLAGLAARGVWHMQGWDWFGNLFGYERFDPFLTAGARGWMLEGQVGPAFGVGAFYYLGDSWALRFDAEVVVGLDSSVEAVHCLSAGLQYSF